MENYNVRVNSTSGISFGTLSWIVWVVFMILYYGTSTIADWPVFWIWFPFWLPFAILGTELVIILVVIAITAILDC